MDPVRVDDLLSEFFDFNSAAQIIMPEGSPTMDSSHVALPTSSGANNSLYPDILVEFGVQPGTSDDPGDFTNFAKWIPRYKKPEIPCDYCASKRLECWFTYEGQTSCSACNALFRACSFSVDDPQPKASMMSTLHVLQEDTVQSCGGMTGLVALKSWDRFVDQPQEDGERGRKHGTRFSRVAVKVLKDWVDAHRDHPYPTEEEKEQLRIRTGLKSSQISNWLANTRRRTLPRVSRGVSPSIRRPIWPSSTGAIDIPLNKTDVTYDGKPWDIMNPLERWQHSPPENEPASASAIASAVANSRMSNESSLSNSHQSHHNLESSVGSGSYSVHRAPSVTSLGTGKSDSLLSSESFSNLSVGSSRSHGSRNSFHSLGSIRKDRRRRRRTAANPSSTVLPTESRPFQCTFCTDTFRTKYDWMRHEKSLHLSLEKWICAPLGPVLTVSHDGRRECVYCGEENPSSEHLEHHNHSACDEKGLAGRTFYRKDHLSQHLRLVHGCKLTKSMESWKSEATYIKSRCGFCGEYFSAWSRRGDHLSKHFRSGAKMKDWKGCRGFDVSVAAHVTHAMPPYLIGTESRSPYPFSASSGVNPGPAMVDATDEAFSAADQLGHWNKNIDCDGSLVPDAEGSYQKHGVRMPNMSLVGVTGGVGDVPGVVPQSQTCWEILTLRLGHYARNQMENGIAVTDEMLQTQARYILFESDDSWNQTAADNPEWLELFKKAHGLESTSTCGNVDMIEDLGGGVGELCFDVFFQEHGLESTTLNAA